jgi:DNA repair photolyase
MRIETKNTDRPETLKTLAQRHKQGLAPIVENGVVYEPIQAQTILTRNPNPGLRHHWSINPYRGCQFGCTYCFARYTAGFIELNNPTDFERRIFYKQNAPDLVRHLRNSDFYGKPVLLGAGTDPWQPAEARFQITRGILEALGRYPSLDLFCLTKSSLIRRDADVFGKLIQQGNPVGVGFSITTLDAGLARKMEPQAAQPRERFKAMRVLADVGVNVGLMLMPIVPFLTDSEENLDALLGEARASGAQFAHSGALHLRTAPKAYFMPWLEHTFPHLAKEYHRVYDRSAYQETGYQDEIRRRVDALKQKHGFPALEKEYDAVRRQPRKGEQIPLFK